MKNLNEKAKIYLTTLQTDEKGQGYVKLNANDYETIAYKQQAIIKAIYYITIAQENGYNEQETYTTIRELAEMCEQLITLPEFELLTIIKDNVKS